jgi:hypothetical protein
VHPEGDDIKDILSQCLVYSMRKAEKDAIDRHKWLESEKAGYDIGFERAMFDWILRHISQFKMSLNLTQSGGAPFD